MAKRLDPPSPTPSLWLCPCKDPKKDVCAIIYTGVAQADLRGGCPFILFKKCLHLTILKIPGSAPDRETLSYFPISSHSLFHKLRMSATVHYVVP